MVHMIMELTNASDDETTKSVANRDLDTLERQRTGTDDDDNGETLVSQPATKPGLTRGWGGLRSQWKSLVLVF